MMTRIVTILLAALSLLPAVGCEDSCPEPADDTTMTEPEHMGDGKGADWSKCSVDSDCMSGTCMANPVSVMNERMCAPTECIDNGQPDPDGRRCGDDDICADLGEFFECRRFGNDVAGFCTNSCEPIQ